MGIEHSTDHSHILTLYANSEQRTDHAALENLFCYYTPPYVDDGVLAKLFSEPSP